MITARKSRLFRGTFIAGAVVLCVTLVFALRMGFSYDGKCGGFFPEVAAQRPCSLWTYMTGDVVAISLAVAITYWPMLLLLIVVAGLTGYFFARGARHGGAR